MLFLLALRFQLLNSTIRSLSHISYVQTVVRSGPGIFHSAVFCLAGIVLLKALLQNVHTLLSNNGTLTDVEVIRAVHTSVHFHHE